MTTISGIRITPTGGTHPIEIDLEETTQTATTAAIRKQFFADHPVECLQSRSPQGNIAIWCFAKMGLSQANSPRPNVAGCWLLAALSPFGIRVMPDFLGDFIITGLAPVTADSPEWRATPLSETMASSIENCLTGYRCVTGAQEAWKQDNPATKQSGDFYEVTVTEDAVYRIPASALDFDRITREYDYDNVEEAVKDSFIDDADLWAECFSHVPERSFTIERVHQAPAAEDTPAYTAS